MKKNSRAIIALPLKGMWKVQTLKLLQMWLLKDCRSQKKSVSLFLKVKLFNCQLMYAPTILMEQLFIKMSFGTRFQPTLAKLKESLKSKVNWLEVIWLPRLMCVFPVKLLQEIIFRNNGQVLNCQQLSYPILVVMIRRILWTTWQFQEPIQMSRIVGLHGKQAQMMIGHLSCLVIQEI